MSRLLAVVSLLACSVAWAQAPEGESVAERTQVGSLARTAAALHNTLDVFRLALSELVPATHVLREAGEAEGATPETPIPPGASEVFARLARVVPLRAAAEALPAISRGYHAEALDALEALAAARTLGETGAPLRELSRALERLERAASDIVDLFSRQRPMQVRIVDPETALDDVNEALDEVAAAEQRIGDLRASRGTPADQLRAFMRLEVALAHALDLIAAAEESGVRIGFDMQKPTASFARVAGEMIGLRQALAEAAADLVVAPTLTLDAIHAHETTAMSEDGNQRFRHLSVSFSGARAKDVAAVRVERLGNADDVTLALVQQTLCLGADFAQALARTREAPVDPSRGRLGDLKITDGQYRASFVEPPGESAVRSELVLTPVSAFGIAGSSIRVPVAYLAKHVGEPRAVRAALERIDPREPRFYRDFDAVRIAWGRAIGDVAPDQRLAGTARVNHAAVVTGYRVARLSGDKAIVVGKTAAGVTEIVDRPTATELAAGVRYRVTALASNGAEVVSNEACPPQVRVDLREDLQLARLGAGSLSRPASFERTVEHELESDVTLAKARAAFEMRAADAQEALLTRWWRGIPLRERTAWLARWPLLMSANEREAWLSSAHEGMRPADFEAWALPELYLADQPEEVRNEVDRWWGLIGVKARTASYNRWIANLSSSHRAYVEHTARAGGQEGLDATRPLRVTVWWASRGETEHQRARAWWERLDSDAQRLRMQAWMTRLDPLVQVAVRWPELEVRAAGERDELLANAYRDLPSALWRRALAWMAWESMDGGARAGIVRSEVPGVARLAAQLAYAVRPLDAALGFNLRMLLSFSLFATLFAMAVRRVIRSRGALKLRRLPAFDALDRVAAAARTSGGAAVAVPGLNMVNDAQTLAGLHLIDRAADVTAAHESVLVVADREPFVRHSGLEEGVSGAGYALDEHRALAGDFMPFLPSGRDVVTQTPGAAAMFVGRLPPEILLVTSALRPDAVTLTATGERAALAVAAASQGEVLMGDAVYAAAADSSRQPSLLTTVLAGDWMKLAVLAVLGLLLILASSGVFG
ncbi:MAG: DUF6754 domain-containing protein [Myxococcota bacterium]